MLITSDIENTHRGQPDRFGLPFVVRIAVLTAAFAALFALIQYTIPTLIAFDGYFHIKFSYLLGEKGFIRELPWLQHTIHRESFRDHHLLFHYLLIPFTSGDLNQGGKLAAVIFAVIMGMSIYILLERSGVALAFFFAIAAVLSSGSFLFRMSLLRVQSLSLALIMLMFLFCMQRKYLLIYLTSLIFVWLYDAFPLLLILSGAFIASEWLIEKKINLRLLAFTVLGISTGMILNPYFPGNVISLFYNISRTIFHSEDVRLGLEWAPYDAWFLLKSSLPAFIIFSLTVLFLPFAGRLKTEEYTAIFLNILFLVLTMKARRFIEYWPVFAFLSAGFVIGRRVPRKHLFILLLLMTPLFSMNIRDVMSEIRNSINPKMYEGSAKWLIENSEPFEIVFNADWDDFPFLFFYNHKNYYILGLDPMYMYTHDKKKYRLYQAITKGNVDKPGKIIGDEFGARFIFIDRDHFPFYDKLMKDPDVQKVFEDEGGLVFEVTRGSSDQEQVSSPKISD